MSKKKIKAKSIISQFLPKEEKTQFKLVQIHLDESHIKALPSKIRKDGAKNKTKLMRAWLTAYLQKQIDPVPFIPEKKFFNHPMIQIRVDQNFLEPVQTKMTKDNIEHWTDLLRGLILYYIKN